MKHILIALGLAVVVLPLAAAAQQDTPSTGLMQAMEKTQKSMPKPTGDVDRDFAAMMIVHHKGAIEMANVLLERGKDAQLKKMAKKMIGDQTKEIKQLESHLAKQK